jgi:hypothetical protein
MEHWRDIPGYEGIYQVSNMGNVRTCEGKTTYTKLHGVRKWKQRILKQKIYGSKKGRADARVSLWKNGKEKTWLVSRLVGLAWCNGYADGLTINHINGDHLDNRAENLEWVTLAENIKKGFETGLYESNQKPVRLVCNDGCLFFPSMAVASRFLGRNSGYLSNCIKVNSPVTATDGKQYTVKDIAQ